MCQLSANYIFIIVVTSYWGLNHGGKGNKSSTLISIKIWGCTKLALLTSKGNRSCYCWEMSKSMMNLGKYPVL